MTDGVRRQVENQYIHSSPSQADWVYQTKSCSRLYNTT